jgi:SAM-dependent methyltransferase
LTEAGRTEIRLTAATPRPFYGAFAWAYDFLIPRPVAAECAGIAATLTRRGVAPDAAVLDAGCGTGRYALELARLGYRVTGLDRSPELLAEARRAAEASVAPAAFVLGDLLALPAARSSYDALLCRGVLNDILEDSGRDAAFRAFAGALRAGGVLLLDVRDWEATATDRSRRAVAEKRVETPRGALTFRTVTRLDADTRALLISETHVLAAGDRETTARYEFAMRCWTREELGARLGRAGFTAIEYAPGYEAVPGDRGDRIVAVASKDDG